MLQQQLVFGNGISLQTPCDFEQPSLFGNFM